LTTSDRRIDSSFSIDILFFETIAAPSQLLGKHDAGSRTISPIPQNMKRKLAAILYAGREKEARKTAKELLRINPKFFVGVRIPPGPIEITKGNPE